MTYDTGPSPGAGRGKRPYRAAYQQARSSGRSGYGYGGGGGDDLLRAKADNEPTHLDQQLENTRAMDAIDERMGFHRFQEGPPRLGWLINMHPTLVHDKDTPSGRAGVDYYFLEEDGNTFKATIVYSPYFLIACKPGTESEVEDYLKKQYEGTIEHIEQVHKEDLKMANHLLGLKRAFIKLSFRSVRELLTIRKIIMPAVKHNASKTDTELDAMMMGADPLSDQLRDTTLSKRTATEILDNIVDIREYDIPYYIRVAIDNDIRVGLWYDVRATNGTITLTHRADLVKRPEPVVLAFDIETTKLPLKFPDAAIDSIMMISYMVDGQDGRAIRMAPLTAMHQGYLITNRDIVSQDIDDFEYTPKPEFDGPFHIFNEADEAIGFFKDEQDEYKSHYAIHMDCFRWVKRDSYLPVGSHGLKAVAKAKLGYNPDEIDPEDMTRFAAERPQTLAQYSVSDAVATYYLYMKYVHPFIFSLCNIIPSNGDEVLRKGSGTLCELLLMVEAYRANVIIPNKYQEPHEKLFDGHLLESETYVGGHVEALEAGVFRSDIPIQFKIVPSAAQQLIDQVDAAIRFTVEVENKRQMSDVLNYDEIRADIVGRLADLRDRPERQEEPRIYHLDVAAMYPNIILTNRLQPDAIVDERICATCDFNLPGKQCDRRMNWLWRGQYFQADRNEYRMIKNQLLTEQFPGRRPTDPMQPFHQLPPAEQTTIIRKRIGDYSRRVYTRLHATKVVEREAIICQRENPFYINTVRSFRDRRYEYKGLHKTWKKRLDTAANAAEQDEARKMVIVYDSLQLAHKCILTSFYGYVMRKAAR
ncbi:ribonuclease H-like domain-containing protein, partial [Syncephalis pseudoplumigaleata]